MNENSINIALIGCGNIGFRHLQSLVQLTLEVRIFIIEPNHEQHIKIEEFLREVKKTAKFDHVISSSIVDLPLQVDLAVLATNSGDRYAAFENLLSRSEVKSIIFEKVLFQTISELNLVEKKLADHNITAYVNYGRRGFPSYRKIAEELKTEDMMSITVEGSNYGLACNGLHFIDLFEMLTQSKIVELNGSDLEPGYEESKRNGYIEVYGLISGESSSGTSFKMSCNDNPDLKVAVKIKTKNGTISIDEISREIDDFRENTDNITGDFESYYVSQSPFFYKSIIENETCLLTAYHEAARQHRLFIQLINKHLGLSSTDTTICHIS